MRLLKAFRPGLWLVLGALTAIPVVSADRPNIIFILADDLGYGELGAYGQKQIATPHLDRMAKEGMKFTQFYAGSSVCAPSRSVLMTGQHTGHTRVRGNAGRERPDAQTLQAGDGTIAQMLRDAGYATGLIGKWGLGAETSAGEPRTQGFDYYFGFLNQTHAHNNYPDFLWRNGERVSLPNDRVQIGEVEGTGYATKREANANDLFFADAEEFVSRHSQEPFFLYLAITTPHANNERSRALGDGNEVPDEEYEAYADQPWNTSQKGHAAMISRMDRQVGSLLARLKELGLDEKTLVFFTSDNGAHREGGPDYAPEFFDASGPLRGIKRDLYDGGIRVPLLARWPGRVPAGAVSDHAAYFGDVMATLAEVANVKPPVQRDSLSFMPALTGKPGQVAHEYLYWELYEGGISQAVVIGGRWKVIQRKLPAASVELFDLQNDLGERTDVAAKHPEIMARAQQLFASARVDNEHWQLDRAMPAPAP